MVKQINKAVSGPRFNKQTNLYQLRIGKIILESDSRCNFYLRKNELLRINGKVLPKSIKFVIQDETISTIPEMVNVKVILERIDVQEYSLKFEESSEAKRWSAELAMNEYYEQRVDQLRSRQFAIFDLVIQTSYNDGHFFLIQYSVHIADINTEQINKLIMKATDAVHKSSENFDCSHFMYLD